MSNREINYDQFVRNFYENTSAQKYYKSRKLSKKLIDQNLIGFCPVYSRYEFPLLRGRLIVPIFDVHNNLLAMAGRQIPDLIEKTVDGLWDTYKSEPSKAQDRISKWNKGKWINEPYQRNKNLFFLNKAKHSARIKNYLLFVEGYFDVYSFFDNGIENVVALCGTSISDYQVALASRYCDNFVIILDSDDAGNIAARKSIQKIEDLGFNAFQVVLPQNMDPDDFAESFDLNFLDKSIKDMIDNGNKKIIIGGTK